MSTPKKRGRPRKTRETDAIDSPPSLPPAVGETGDTSSVSDAAVPAKREYYKYNDTRGPRPFPEFKYGTVMYEKLQRIIAMRVAGVKTSVIAETLNISPQTCRSYLYNARKQGLIEEDGIDTAREHLEFAIVPKAVQNLYDALHDDTRHVTSGMRVADQVALEVTKGTIFKEFDRTVDIAQSNNAIQINVVMPPGPEQTIREGAISGVPAFVDGETI